MGRVLWFFPPPPPSYTLFCDEFGSPHLLCCFELGWNKPETWAKRQARASHLETLIDRQPFACAPPCTTLVPTSCPPSHAKPVHWRPTETQSQGRTPRPLAGNNLKMGRLPLPAGSWPAGALGGCNHGPALGLSGAAFGRSPAQVGCNWSSRVELAWLVDVWRVRLVATHECPAVATGHWPPAARL